MKPVSVLGRYSAIVAAVVFVFVIAASVIAHTLGRADPFIDSLAVLALGIIAGTAGTLSQLNGTVQRTNAQDVELAQLRAHVVRIDAAAAASPALTPPDGR